MEIEKTSIVVYTSKPHQVKDRFSLDNISFDDLTKLFREKLEANTTDKSKPVIVINIIY